MVSPQQQQQQPPLRARPPPPTRLLPFLSSVLLFFFFFFLASSSSAVVVVEASTATTTPNVCPSSDWELVGGRCLRYVSDSKAAQNAGLGCGYYSPDVVTPGENEYHLVDPRTEAENDWVWDKCKGNDGPFPSAWNVWDSSSAPPTAGPYPAAPYSAPDVSSVTGTPKFACVCPAPATNADSLVWCSTNTNGAFGQGLVTTAACTAATTSGTCSSGTPCRRPDVLPTNTAKTGRGACWLGASRRSVTSLGEIQFDVSPGVTRNILPLNKLHASFGALATTYGSQSRYTFTPAYSPTALAPPNCVAMWNWFGTAQWTLDYCGKQLPSVCVADARCAAGHIRTQIFSVDGTSGAVTQPQCSKCPGGTFRVATQAQASCTDCRAGYYGSPSSVRTSDTCTGVCLAGTWCATGASQPTPCGAGFYGKALAQASGPGYTSFDAGCLSCPAGKYCPNAQSVLADAVSCQAGYCGYEAQSTPQCSKRCEAGYYCPTGTECPGRPCGSSGVQSYPVGANAYCPEGSTAPQTVPTGKYSVGDTINTGRSVTDCPNGYSCNLGVRTPCPEGKYSGTGFTLAERTACKTCAAGYYCAAPASPTDPGSTSPTQAVCPPAGSQVPAEYYCVNGLRNRIPSDQYMTVPVDVAVDIRQGMVACPSDKICANGIAYNRLDWVNCPNNALAVTVPELWNQTNTDVLVSAQFFRTVIPGDYTLDYRLMSQAFATPSDLLTSTSASCKLGATRNDGIFVIDPATGRLRVNRFAPDDHDASKALDFEVCEPLTDIRYKLVVQASARHNTITSIQANLTCAVTLTVSDVNDRPIFSAPSYNRVLGESSAENTQAARCQGVLTSTGCPNDATPTADNAVGATDQDAFGQGNLEYSFVGVQTNSVYDKLTINTCTGLISQKGGAANVLRFSDTNLEPYNTVYKRLTYTVQAMDDGNGVYANRLAATATVYVYILNVNDAPVFTSPSSIEIWVPESTSSGRAPAGTHTLPDTLAFTDDDPNDDVTLYLSRNDGSAFAIVGNTLRTTAEGAQSIDFESTKKSYSVDIEARDNGQPAKSAFITVTIKVANLNDPPVIESAPSFYIWENAQANDPVCRGDEATRCGGSSVDSIHRIQVTDPDNLPATDLLTFALTSNPGNKFKINSATGQVSLVASDSLDFEDSALNTLGGTGRGYTLEVSVTSSGGGIETVFPQLLRPETARMTFNVYVVDVNEAPTFTPLAASAFRVVETWPVGVVLDHAVVEATDPDNVDLVLKGTAAPQQTLTFSAVSNPADAADGEEYFSVSTDPSTPGRARIVLKKALDFETAPACVGTSTSGKCYRLVVQVADNGNPQGTRQQTVQFDVVDVNEPPSFSQAGYSVSVNENQDYASVVDLVPAVQFLATDPDAGHNALLTYKAVGGDGFAEFGLANLAPSLGFKLFKNTSVLLDYETKPTYTLRVQVTDMSGTSSSVGKACTQSQGLSVGCNEGATCVNSRCHEICPQYRSATQTLLPADVPREDVFFCKNMVGIDNLVLDTQPFRETAEVLVTITLGNTNDKPFIVDRGLTVPQPTILHNAQCNLRGAAQFQAITTRDQFALRTMSVWDDDRPNPGSWAGPFTFSKVNTEAAIWKVVTLSTTTGAVVLPKCGTVANFVPCDQMSIDQSWSGQVRVTDVGGASSVCGLTVTLTDANTLPFVGYNIDADAVPENTEPEYDGLGAIVPRVIFAGLTETQLNAIDSDRTVGDSLTFSASFSTYFEVNRTNARVTLKAPLDYESSQPEGFKKTILVSVTDSYGASDSFEIIIPVQDVNEAPKWTSAPLTATGQYHLVVAENTQGQLDDLAPYVSDPDTFAVIPSWKQTTISVIQTDPSCDLACIPVRVDAAGKLVVKPGVTLNFESRRSWDFGLRVNDGPGLASDIAAHLQLTDVNEPPELQSGAKAHIPEGSGGPSGLDLLDMTQFVVDPDAADPSSALAFNITSGNTGNVFEIKSGKLRIAPNQVLDYENINLYTLGVSVGDTAGHIDTGFVIVNVTNVVDVTVTSIQLDSATPQLSCTGEARTVTITGTNFGMLTPVAGTVFQLSYRRSVANAALSAAPVFTTTACTVTTSNTVAKCTLTQGGSGVDFVFSVSITVPGTSIQGDTVSNVATTIDFPAPTITSITGVTLMPTSGGNTVTINGQCLGSIVDSMQFGNNSRDSFVEFCRNVDNVCTTLTNCASTSATGAQVVCTSAIPAGLGASVKFRVQSARQLSDYLTAGGYGLPTVSGTSITSLKTSGQIASPYLVITGTNFGQLDSVPSGAYLTYTETIGGTRSFALLGCKVTTAFTRVTCTSTEPGFGVGLRVYVVFGEQTNTQTSQVSFEAPTVTGISTAGNTASPSKGGLLVTITGTSFGPTCGNPGVSATDGAVNCGFIRTTYSRGSLSVLNSQPIVYAPLYCAVVSQTSIVCGTVPGTGSGHKWTVLLAGQQAPATNFMTRYSSPSVGSYENHGSHDAITRGNQEIDIRGSQFGPVGGAPIQVTYGNELFPHEFTALNCYVITDHEMIRCLTAVGAGDGLGWKVVVDGQLSRSELSNYGPPVIDTVMRSPTLQATGLNPDGGQTVYLTGNNFGIPHSAAYLEQVVFGPAGTPALYDITSHCTVTSHETLACVNVPGTGQNLVWKVTVRGQSSQSANAQSSYALPTLTALSANNASSAGAVPLRLTVSNLPFCDVTNSRIRVQFGQTYVDQFTVRAEPSLVDPLEHATFCANPAVASSSEVRQVDILVPEMVAGDRVDIRVRVESLAYGSAGYHQTTAFPFQYDPPVISEVYAEPGDTGSNVRVTLSGRNFCKSEACCQTYYNGVLLTAQDVITHDHTVIVFTASGPGNAFVKCPSAQSPTVSFSSRNPFIYGAVRASDFARLDGVTFNTQGTEDVYVFSMYATPETRLTIGGVEATGVTVVAFDCLNGPLGFVPNTIDGVLTLMVPGQTCHRIQGRVPAGQGLNNEVVISVGNLKSKADDFRFEFLRYMAPSIGAVSSSFSVAYPTAGNNQVLLTITGTNFGRVPGSIVFGNSTLLGTRTQIVCTATSPGFTWTHTQVGCNVPPGEGRELGVRVLAGGQLSPESSQGKLRYLEPTITSLKVEGTGADNAADTRGGEVLLITGTNFGRPYNSRAVTTSPGYLAEVKLGARSTCAVLTMNHTHLRCTIPEGDGGNIDLLVRTQNQNPMLLAPQGFNYGIPVITSISPELGNTDGLTNDGTGRQLFTVTGRNFGATDTKLQFNTTGGSVLVLGERRPNDFLNTFQQVSHTSMQVYLEPFVGKNISVWVIASKQTNAGAGPKFSYYPPSIGGVTVTPRVNAPAPTVSPSTTPTSAPVAASGRRRRRQLSEDFDPLIDNIAWSSFDFGNCISYISPNDTVVGTSYAYRVKLEIDATGAYSQTYSLHKLTDYTSANRTACTTQNKVGDATRSGQFTDMGELPNVGCVRIYNQTVTSSSGGIPGPLFPNGGLGVYIISDKREIFTSLPGFATLDEALLRGSSSADFAFDDVRSAELLDGPLTDALDSVPTTGCEPGFWEDISDYLQRQNENTEFAILPRKCLSPVIVEVTGHNMGTDCQPMIADCVLHISLVDMERGKVYEGSTTSSEGNHGMLCETCYRTNLMSSFRVPFGAGRNLYVNVTVGGQTDISGPLLHYEPPRVDYLAPGTLSNGNPFQSAVGNENIQLIGDNLGYTNTSLSILMNGMACNNATWISGRQDKNGQDSLECKTRPDVVGLKSVFLCVGGQAKAAPIRTYHADVLALQYGQANRAWNTTVGASPNVNFTQGILSTATSRCPNGFYGRLGEICLPCPEGGLCHPAIALPIAKPDFFLLNMVSSSERANASGACQREHVDSKFRLDFPELVQFDTCSQIVKCIPADSCLGSNQCAEGYEYQLKRCRLVRNRTESDNTCRTWFDGNTKQFRGVHSDCQKNTAPGASCSHDHPEDCAQCQLSYPDGSAAPPVGTCECTVSERCSLCTASEFYRLNGECIACPDNPALVFALFILAGLAVILFAYWFQKKKINLAFISIGVDYFQVLAVLSTTNVPWPPMIRAIFQIFFIFLASIDIAAPECLIPNFEFSTKFYLTELMPLLALAILLLIHTTYSLAKVYRFGKEAKWLSHVSRLVGIFVLILYVLYLSLTKKALDVFNCNPLDPDDGFSYTTFSSLSCDGGGLCRCNEPGGVQESLVVPAVVFLVLYTFGFPLAVFSIVSKYKEQIREDQYLRANLLGDRRETNPRAYDVRKKFQLMYMHFKPRYSFWMLSILGRKFGIAFASLMFRGNPSFQLAVVLIVLFIAFTMQVSIRPYMSPGEFPVVVKELNDNSRKADDDLELYARDREMYRKVGECMRIQAELMRKEKMHRHKMGAGFWEESKAAAREHDQRSATEKYFFDLNAVESTLLGCLIIISLSGIMFESGRFQSRPDLEWQGSLVITLVFVVLFGSLAYYLMVLINELCPHQFAKYCGRYFLRYQNEGLSQEDLDRMKDNELKLDANPLFAADGPIGDKSKSLMKEIDASKSALALAKRQNDELKRLKSELEAQGGGQTVSNPLALRELTSSLH